MHEMNEADLLLPSTTTTTTTATAANNHGTRFPTWNLMLQQQPVLLPNQGSTARDHLANERTFLAWIRTALALVGVGIGLLKITSVNQWAGYAVICVGVLTLLNACWRYFHVMRLMSQHGKFQPNVTSILALVMIMLLVIVLFVYLSLTGQLLRHGHNPIDNRDNQNGVG